MAKTANFTVNIDINPIILADAEAVCARYGLTVNEAIHEFLCVTWRTGFLPFDLLNAETLEDEDGLLRR